MIEYLPALLRGLLVTAQLALGGIALCIVLSFLAGLGRVSRAAPVRWIALAYIEVFRGTSALVQLFWFFFVLPHFGVNLSPFATGVIVLGLNAGAYGAEVVRGAVQSVPQEQWEACTALNLTRFQSMTRVIIPQAVISMIPPFGNIFIELLKNTALVSMVSLTELTFAAKLIRDDTLQTGIVFGMTLVLYFMASLLVTAAMRGLEKLTGAWRPQGAAA